MKKHKYLHITYIYKFDYIYFLDMLIPIHHNEGHFHISSDNVNDSVSTEKNLGASFLGLYIDEDA
jgi:hypothetical protein